MMQVFLPYPDFRQSVACLDKSRLGNQIWRECKTLLNGGWANHPVAKMWADYKPALAIYCLHGLEQLKNRGDINNESFLNLQSYFWQYLPNPNRFLLIAATEGYKLPPFIGDPDFHRSHRLNLLWKDPTWYCRFFDDPIPTTKPEYVWFLPPQP